MGIAQSLSGASWRVRSLPRHRGPTTAKQGPFSVKLWRTARSWRSLARSSPAVMGTVSSADPHHGSSVPGGRRACRAVLVMSELPGFRLVFVVPRLHVLLRASVAHLGVSRKAVARRAGSPRPRQAPSRATCSLTAQYRHSVFASSGNVMPPRDPRLVFARRSTEPSRQRPAARHLQAGHDVGSVGARAHHQRRRPPGLLVLRRVRRPRRPVHARRRRPPFASNVM